MSFIFKFKSNNGTYTLFDGAYSFVIETSKYTVIDCAKLTNTDLLTLAQHVFIGEIITLHLIDFYAYVQLRLLGNLSNIEIQEEGEFVGEISKFNFAGEGVTATLDEDDETGKTALVTITGNAQSISKLIIENPELVYDNLLEVYTAPVVLTDPITDVYISTNNEWHGSGDEGGELSDSTIIVVSMILENYTSGDIVRVSLSSNYGTNPVIFRALDGEGFAQLLGSTAIGSNATTSVWTFEKRDDELVLMSTNEISIDDDNINVVSPYVRFDQYRSYTEDQKTYVKDSLGLVSQDQLDGYDEKATNVIFSESTPFTTYDGMFSGGKHVYLMMSNNSINTVNLNYLAPETGNGQMLTIVQIGFGDTRISFNTGTTNYRGAGGYIDLFKLSGPGSTVTVQWNNNIPSEFGYGWTIVSTSIIGQHIVTNATTSFTVDIADLLEGIGANAHIRMTSSSSNTVIIAKNNTASCNTGTTFTVIRAGSGTTTLVAGANTILNGNLIFNSIYDAKILVKVSSVLASTDVWDVMDMSNLGVYESNTNKVTDFSTVDDITYPTTEAVEEFINNQTRYIINKQITTAYTILNTDISPRGNKILALYDSALPISTTLDNIAYYGGTIGDSITIIQGDDGILTVSQGAGITFTTGADVVFGTRGKAITFISSDTNEWLVIGG